MSAESDAVWNRAAMERGGVNPRPGDTALAALLRLHNAAMSGGLLDVLTDSLTADEVGRAQEGYRYFGLAEAADVVGTVVSEPAGATEDQLDALEAAADARYAQAVGTDSVLTAAFEARFLAAPEDFAAL